MVQARGKLRENVERAAQREAELERLLTNFGGLGEVHQGHQRLFEKRDGLTVRVACEGTLARPARIHQRGVPAVSLERMMREPIYMVVQAVRERRER